MSNLEFSKTQRGFDVASFADENGEQCSLQASSIMSDQPCIWLGIDHVTPKVCVYGEGWKPVGLPTDGFAGRMHLTQDMVKSLLPALQRFALTGELAYHGAMEVLQTHLDANLLPDVEDGAAFIKIGGRWERIRFAQEATLSRSRGRFLKTATIPKIMLYTVVVINKGK